MVVGIDFAGTVGESRHQSGEMGHFGFADVQAESVVMVRSGTEEVRFGIVVGHFGKVGGQSGTVEDRFVHAAEGHCGTVAA